MTLYKFKPLTDFEFVADIIMNDRLYSAELDNLNDPMEGLFQYDHGIDRKIVEGIFTAKKQYKVCALTEDFKNPTLWAHYADSFNGICIEIEVDEDIITPHKITYIRDILLISHDRSDKLMGEPQPDAAEMAIQSLTRKFKDWEYEQEFRLLNSNGTPYIESGIKVKSVLFGLRTSIMYQDIIRKIVPEGVALYYTTIDSKSQVERFPYSTEPRD